MKHYKVKVEKTLTGYVHVSAAPYSLTTEILNQAEVFANTLREPIDESIKASDWTALDVEEEI